MATLSLGEATQQLWDEALTRVLNLSTATVKRNAELEERLANLEVELAVWKQAHAVAVDTSEREAKAHNAHVASLNRQISSLDSFNSQSPLILCVIDGDGNLFTQSLLTQGQRGGRCAAQQLTKGIAEFLSKEDAYTFGRQLSFWVTVYFNKAGLLNSLVGHDICTQEQLDSFLAGFSQASPRFSVVDVGDDSEFVEAKIREYVQIFTRFPQTIRVFLGPSQNADYLPTLTMLEHEQLLGKVVLLQEHNNDPTSFQSLPIPTLKVDGLFMTRKLSRVPKKPSPVIVAAYSTVTTNGGLVSPESPPPSAPARCGPRLVDPSLPLHKQDPPPCNEHYLMSCSKGTACKYSHDYLLTQDQLATLASNAKKAPCNWLKNGLHCPYGERCCWGHVCPSGSKCFHLSKGKCWFKGDAMHPTSPVEEQPTSPMF